jgi:murein DD-endopeptidase MepM/ murein hydrolase activator NlpD
MVGFASGLMTTISGALAGLSISSVAVWGPIVAILVFILIIIGPLISAMLPPGRGMGGGVVDQTTLNGGYLAAPAWSGDINDLPDSCPPDSLPIGGTVTQGPEAIGCSHAPYKNTIDVATNNTSATATHDGVVETVANMGSGYGQFVDIRAKCNSVVFVTRYAHLAVGLQQVAKGQKITRGTVVGLTDNSGNSTGPHLHYEIRGLTTDHFAKWSGCCVDNGIACQN